MVRLTDRPDMTLDVYRGRKTTKQQQQQPCDYGCHEILLYDAIYCARLAYRQKFALLKSESIKSVRVLLFQINAHVQPAPV